MLLNSFTPAEIELTERRRLEQPLLLLVWLATATFSLAEGNFFYLLGCTLAVGVNLIAVRRHKEVFVNRILVNFGVLVSGAIVLAEFRVGGQNSLIPFGHFIVLMQLCKLFAKKRNRDYTQLLILSFILMIVTAMLSFELWFALALMIYLVLLSYVTMILTIKRGLDRAASTKLTSESGPLSPKRIAWNVIRRWPGRPIFQMTSKVLIPSLTIGILAFLLIPRVSEGLTNILDSEVLFSWQNSGVRLGKDKKLYRSPRVVMRVRVFQNKKPGTVPFDESAYLRGNILETYADSRWSPVPFRASSLSYRQNALDDELKTKLISHKIELLAFTQLGPVGPYPTVTVGEQGASGFGVSRDGNFSVAGRFHRNIKQRYVTGSFGRPLTRKQRQYMKKLECDPRRKIDPQRQVTLPAEAGRKIDALAQRWTSDLLTTRDARPGQSDDVNLKIARRLAHKLMESYPYSLDLSNSDPARDGVEDFLFHMKKGHCEYFAAALAVMCCRLDIPARVATGFVLNEYNPETQQYTVREKDAHAWCEIYHPKKGWVLVDPTPGNDRIESMKQGWWEQIKNLWTELRFLWVAKVVRYDSVSQRDMGNQVVDKAIEAWKKLSAACANVWNSFLNLLMRGVVDQILLDFFWLFIVVSGLTGVWLVGRRIYHAKKMQKNPEYVASLRKLAALQKLMAAMDRYGYPKSETQTLHNYLSSAAKKFALPADVLEQVGQLQNRWRWGRQAPGIKELRTVQQQCKLLNEQLKQTRKV